MNKMKKVLVAIGATTVVLSALVFGLMFAFPTLASAHNSNGNISTGKCPTKPVPIGPYTFHGTPQVAIPGPVHSQPTGSTKLAPMGPYPLPGTTPQVVIPGPARSQPC